MSITVSSATNAELTALWQGLDAINRVDYQGEEELRSFRYSLGGGTPPIPVQVAPAPNVVLVEEGAIDPRTQWTPEQAEMLKREEERVREHARFNHNMPRPSVNIQRNSVQIPPGMSPASVLPAEMQEFLRT